MYIISDKQKIIFDYKKLNTEMQCIGNKIKIRTKAIQFVSLFLQWMLEKICSIAIQIVNLHDNNNTKLEARHIIFAIQNNTNFVQLFNEIIANFNK